MKFREKWKRFWTLDVHHAEGFTLVELIVVIAIMAILAGVGTVGYSGYIKSANKNADKVLVGNIIRAIETGTNSTMFVNDDSFAIGNIAYPVGFITLTTDGTNVVTSAADVEYVEGACKFVSLTISYAGNGTSKTFECPYATTSWYDKTATCYECVTETVYYCTTHQTNATEIIKEVTEDTATSYVSGYTHNGTKGTMSCKNHGWSASYVTIPSGSTTVTNRDLLYQPSSSDSTLCELAYANQNGTFVGSGTETNDSSNPLYQSIAAAFGDVGSLKLTYDGWTTDEGVNYATLLTASDSLINSVKSTGDTLITTVPLMQSAANMLNLNMDISSYLSEDYADSSEMMDAFAGHVTTQFPSNENGEWDAVWKNAASYNGIDYTFGMNDATGYHHDFVYAATKSYNTSFATYLTQNNIPDTFTEVIIGYSSPVNETDKLSSFEVIPRVVNTAAFNGAKSRYGTTTLEDKFVAAGTKNNAYTDQQCREYFTKCKDLYAQYIDDSNGTSVCEQNGGVFYDMMNTVVATSEAARDTNNKAGNGNYFDYYNHYLAEMSSLYNAATGVDEGIVIIVTVENGLVQCDVSPSAANPRND